MVSRLHNLVMTLYKLYILRMALALCSCSVVPLRNKQTSYLNQTAAVAANDLNLPKLWMRFF